MNTIKQEPAQNAPIEWTGLQSLAVQCLIPALILTAVISNQLEWTLGPIVGQALGWLAILCASIIIVSTFRKKLWPWILIMLVLTAKGLQIVFDAEGESYWFSCYIILYGCLLVSAAAIMISCRLDLIYKQIYIICLLNVIFMFLQVAGIADWSHFVATHSDAPMETYPIAFFDNTSDFDVTQRRPSGLLYSSQYLSIIALFGLAIHFSRKSNRIATGTFVMCAMVVLSMAKLVFLGFILMGLFVIISGTTYQRQAILRGFALAILLAFIYAVLFPGLFESNMRIDQLIFSFSTRISNILLESGAENALTTLQDIAAESKDIGVNIKLYDTNFEFEDRISGYVDLVRILPFLIVLIFAITPLYLWGFLKVRGQFQDLTTLVIMSMIIVIITPAAGPLWRAPIYLFIAGFALFPIFVLLQQRYFARL